MSAATILNPPTAHTPRKRATRPVTQRPYTWTIKSYHLAVDAGVFDEDPHVELINGELVRTLPENPPHVVSLELANAEVARVFALVNCHTRNQHPVTLPPRSEPEPDICVVRGSIRDYAAKHPAPADILLLIEISESTLAFDRATKARIYARAGIAEYWILNVNARTLEVYRNPQNGAYPTPIIYDETMSLLPLAAPPSMAPVAVADLLP